MVLEQYIANDYLRSLIIAIIILLLARIIVSIFFGTLKGFTKRTKTDVDDKIIKRSVTPLTITIFLFAIKIPLNELPLTAEIEAIVARIISSIIIAVIGYLIYALFDIIIVRAWRGFAKRTKTNIDESLTSLIHTLLRITIIILVGLYILDLWGIEIGPLLAGLGIAGLAVALALQPVLANIFSGVSMILDKSLKVGDLVYLDVTTRGKVEKIGLRSTKIRTFDNELIIIPNTKLAESQIQNIALPEPKSRAIIPFGVAYGSDVNKVKKIVIKELKSISGVSKDPEPFVRFTEMAASSLNFNAYFYVDNFENRASAKDEANTKIYNALNKAKIEIPFPQMDVNMKKR